MPSAVITVLDTPSEEDHLAILNPLLAFNDSQTGDDGYEQIAIMLKDEAGNSVGGLWAIALLRLAFCGTAFRSRKPSR